MVTVNYTNINPAAGDGEVFATITASQFMMSMWLLDNYGGALTLVMVSPTTYNVVVVDSSALPSIVALSVQGYSMSMESIANNNVTVTIESMEANPDATDTQINEAVTAYVLANDDNASDATVISVSVDPVQGTAVIEADGRVTFTPAQDYLGNAVVTYTIKNAAGETSTSTLTITVSDTSAPTQTTTITSIIDDVEFNVGVISDGGYTNDTQPELQGTISSTLDTNEVVAVYRDGVKVGTATVNGTTWTYQETTKLTDGAHEYTARVEDNAGNLGTDSNEYNLIVDTVAPKQATTISDIIDDVAPIIGTVTNGGTTNDTAPLIEGTISFTLGTEEKIVVLRDGVEIGIATVNGTTWSFADSSLADGKTYTYTARVEDAAGNRGAISTGYEITIDSSVPTQNVTIDTIYDNVAPYVGDIASGDITNDTTPELQGSIDAPLATNEVVAIYRDGVFVGNATTNGSKWTYTDSGLTNGGDYTYTAKVVDTAGNTGPVSNDYEINILTNGPTTGTSIVGIIDNVSPVTGNIANNGFTNDTTPELQGTITAGLKTGEVVAIYRDGVKVGEATVNGTTWSYTDSGLKDGEDYKYMARVEDAAGNPGGDSNAYTINIDTTAPTQDVTIVKAIDNVDPVSGDMTSGTVTNDDTPELQGTITSALGTGETVVVYRDGVEIGKATMTSSTTWSFTDASLSSGTSYEYTAYVKDAAGNLSNVSNAFDLTINTDGVNQTVQILYVQDDVDPVTGVVSNNGFTNDTTPVIEGSVSVALDAGDKVIVFRNGVEIGEATVNGTSWTFADTLVNDGTYTYTALVENNAGDQGAASAVYKITLDTTPPDASKVVEITSITEDTGLNSSDFITNDTSLTVNGTVAIALASDEKIQISTDGGKTWADVSVSGTTWSYVDGRTLIDGNYTYDVRVVDLAGNVGDTDTQIVTVDTTAPDASKVVEITSITEDTGLSSSDFITSDTTLTVNGTLASALASDERAQISIDGGNTWTDVSINGTTWSYVDGRTLIDGNYTYDVRVVDLAGNVGDTDTQVITVDTKAPDASKVIEITSISDDTGINGSDFITDDRTLTINGTLVGTLATDEKAQISIDSGNTWTDVSVNGNTWSYVDGRTLADGDYTYNVRVVDLAGNVGSTDTQVVSVGSANDAPVAVDDITTGGNLGGAVLVSENFENGAKGWTNNSIQNNSNTTNFLGNFGGTDGKEGVLKTFNFGTAHAGETVTIEFDVYELGSWDGDGSWNAANEGGVVESFKTFVNGVEVVSHIMGQDGIDNNSDDGGKIIAGSTGTSYQIDSHHFVVEATVDANGQVKLGFGSTTHESVANESFGIDNVTITAGQNWADVLTTDELTPISIDVLANDFDIDGDSLTISQIQGQDVTSGQIVNITIGGDIVGTAQVVNGEIVFTPGIYFQPMKDGELKNIIFDYSISDGRGGSDSANVAINVTGVTQNHAPTDLVTNIKSVNEYAKAGTIAATMYVVDEDLPDDSHTYALSGKDADKFNIDSNGTITVKTDGSLYLGCEADAKDQVMSVVVTVTDTAGASYSENVDIKITNIMENPIKYWNPCSHQNLNIQGGDNNDCLVTGFGNDTIFACAGDDYIDGNCGNDTIYAGSGNDKIYGGSGNDIIYTGLGADWVDGGCGDDTVSYIYSKEAVNISLDGCKTGIGGDAQGDRLLCVENLIGSNFDDTLKDGCGANVIDGGKGNDNITGDCCDTLIGGEGNDKITVDSVCFKSVDGGDGYDVLNYGNCVGYLDLSNSNSPTVTNIEQINMKDGGWAKDTLVLNAQGVDKITTDGVLMVTGDSNDQVKLESYGHYNDPTDWSKGQDTTVNGTNYSVYTCSGQTVMIESTVSVSFYNTLI